MKSTSTALAAHLAGPVTTQATCWRITRVDGREFFFTDHDQDLQFEGNIYKASSGYSLTAIANDASLSVDNLDVEGVFDSAAITEEELRAGLFDQAEVRIFLVNWADPSMGALRMRRGWFGEVVLTEQGVFRTELRGMTQALQQRIGELYSPECRADLGDHRCKVPINPPDIARSTVYLAGDVVRVPTGTGAGSDRFENRIYRCVTEGCVRLFGDTLPTMPCRQIQRRSVHSATMSCASGCARFGGVAKRTNSHGREWRGSLTNGSLSRKFFILGQMYASPSNTQGRSRMWECRLYGSVRGAVGNNRSYREQ